MSVNRVVVAHFSPTGGTKKVAMALEDGLLDLSTKYRYQVITYNYLSPMQREQRVPEFTPNDLLVLCYPVYFGRMPSCLEQWPELKGNGAKAVVCSVYGNRAIEDAERETITMLKEHGFEVIASLEAIAEHSQDRTLASHRPDKRDKEQLSTMARSIIEKVCEAEAKNSPLPSFNVDTTTPYRERSKIKATPKLLDISTCNECGRCAEVCPAGIIDRHTHEIIPGMEHKCMGCRACITTCRVGIRGFIYEEKLEIIKQMVNIKELNRARKHNLLKWPSA